MKIAFISDIHSNLPALEAVLENVKGMPIYCAGDLVGYGPWPNEVCNLAQSMNFRCVMGNHDNMVVNGVHTDIKSEAYDSIKWTQKHINRQNLQWIARLPKRLDFANMLMVHGSPRNLLNDYVFEHLSYLDELLAEMEWDGIIMGHTHTPYTVWEGERFAMNPGSVGQPRYGNVGASYAIMDTETREIELCTVGYDIDLVTEKIIKEGLPKDNSTRLYEGR